MAPQLMRMSLGDYTDMTKRALFYPLLTVIVAAVGSCS
jgi:hypothetical protein